MVSAQRALDHADRRARATISRSCGRSFMSWTKPCPSSVPSRLFGRQLHVLEEQLRRVGRIHPELLELAAAAEARRIVGLDHHQRDALGALRRIGLGDHDDQVGVLAVGDEGLRAVEHIAVAGFLRGGAHALQVGAGAGLGHGDRADQLAGRELRQPALLLLLGAVMQDIGRDDAGMQRRAERVEPARARTRG